MSNAAPKFTQEFGAFIGGGQGHTLVMASPGYADILIQQNYRLGGGYAVYRRGDDDVVAYFRTQREARAYVLEARQIDLAAERN